MKLKYLKNVVKLELDQEKCVGCGMCLSVCPHGVFEMRDKKAEIKDKNSCMECGACAKNCPMGAIRSSSGVGCAAAIIYGFLNKTEPTCGCSDKGNPCCG